MKNALLVIDDDPVRAGELCLLLRFLEEQQVIHADVTNWRSCTETPELRCVFLGQCGSQEARIGVVQTLRALVPRVVVVLIEEADRLPPLPAMPEVASIVRLSRPFYYSPLSQILVKSQQNSPSRDAKPAQAHRSAELFRILTGNSESITRVRQLIQRVAPSDSTVMILGESGTGKEVVARNIHYYSNRSQGPFVPINCGAIPDNLLESELFGHEKGAFTGAISMRRGRFELARGGTLFLDEIGDMPLNMQVKLLRVLQERTFERVGSDRSIEADVRIITATHQDLDEHIRTGKFREDLFYRLNVFPIEMPTLRERIEDLPLLVSELLERMAHDQGAQLSLNTTVLRCLAHYPWPGNVRELANLMERLVIMIPDGRVEVDDLPAKFRAYYTSDLAEPEPTAIPASSETGDHPIRPASGDAVALPPDGLDLRQYIMDLESSLIQTALDDANGVVAHAAALLKMRRTTLVEKMRKYNIRRGEEGE